MRRSLVCWSWAICLAGAEPVVEAPFDFLHNQIVLRTVIDGQGPYNFVLDTGTHDSTIDLRLARRLRLPLGPVSREAAGAGHGRAAARETVCRRLRVGDLTVENLHAAALDLSRVSQELGRPLHGVLGYGFLEDRIVQIDYFHRRIRFYAVSPFSPSPRPSDGPRRVAFPMRFRAAHPSGARRLHSERNQDFPHPGYGFQPRADPVPASRPQAGTRGSGAPRNPAPGRWLPGSGASHKRMGEVAGVEDHRSGSDRSRLRGKGLWREREPRAARRKPGQRRAPGFPADAGLPQPGGRAGTSRAMTATGM